MSDISGTWSARGAFFGGRASAGEEKCVTVSGRRPKDWVVGELLLHLDVHPHGRLAMATTSKSHRGVSAQQGEPAPAAVPSRQPRGSDDWLDLVQQVVSGDDEAWHSFASQAHPVALEICSRRRFFGARKPPRDSLQEVALQALERIRANDFEALRRYLATRDNHPGAHFMAWFGAVVRNAYIDHLRSLPGHQRRADRGGRQLWQVREESLSDPNVDAMADAVAASQTPAWTAVEIGRILDCIESDSFPRQQRAALALWLRGNSAAEIAEALNLSGSRAGQKVLNAARERLRRAFRGGER